MNAKYQSKPGGYHVQKNYFATRHQHINSSRQDYHHLNDYHALNQLGNDNRFSSHLIHKVQKEVEFNERKRNYDKIQNQRAVTAHLRHLEYQRKHLSKTDNQNDTFQAEITKENEHLQLTPVQIEKHLMSLQKEKQVEVLPDPGQPDDPVQDSEDEDRELEDEFESFDDLSSDEDPLLEEPAQIKDRDWAIFATMIENARNQKAQEEMLRLMTVEEQIQYFDQKMQPREEYVNQSRLEYEVNKVLSGRVDYQKGNDEAIVPKPDFEIKNLHEREAYIDWIRKQYAFEEDFELV